MSNQDQHTSTESEPTRAARRTVIRGAGVAGLLTMGVGTASAREPPEQIPPQRDPNSRPARGRGPTLPPQAAQRAKDRIDIEFPRRNGDPGNGNNDNGEDIQS